jgi:hypothetical protein
MIVGVDIGYGYTKATCGTSQILFPSVIGKAERIRYESDLNGPNGHQADHIAVITEQGDRFVGELAMLQSRVRWTLLDRSRVQDASARLLFLSALSELVGSNTERGAFRDRTADTVVRRPRSSDQATARPARFETRQRAAGGAALCG